MDENVSSEAGIARLKEEQEKSLNACNERINQWTHFQNDYKSLHNFLGTVSCKLQHDVMVPFGKMAFMPGQLVNTNNVLVLLGDNWFVECSTRQAQGIVERRVNSCQDTLNKLEQEKDKALGWVKHTESALGDEGMKEIIEEYDPVKDISWRERRRRNESCLRNNESARAGASYQSKNARIRWEDQEQTQPAVISFKHSSRCPPDSLQFQANTNPEIVQSPGDIWNVFGSPTVEQKSILKPARPSATPTTPSDIVEEVSKPMQQLEKSSQAFTGTIVEKVPTDAMEYEKKDPSRPISRFKTQRSKK